MGADHHYVVLVVEQSLSAEDDQKFYNQDDECEHSPKIESAYGIRVYLIIFQPCWYCYINNKLVLHIHQSPNSYYLEHHEQELGWLEHRCGFS